MKRLYNNKNVAKKIRNRKLLRKFEMVGVKVLLVLEVFWFILERIGVIANRLFDYVSILNAVLVTSGISSSRNDDGDLEYLYELGNVIEAISEKKCEISKWGDLDIIPKNIKIGETLMTANPIPILKSGYYILVKSSPCGFVLRQLEEDGKYHVDILDNEEADYTLLQLVKDGDISDEKRLALLPKNERNYIKG